MAALCRRLGGAPFGGATRRCGRPSAAAPAGCRRFAATASWAQERPPPRASKQGQWQEQPQLRQPPPQQQRTRADLLLGLAVRRHRVGFALLRFSDLTPLQFGLIDTSQAIEVQQKALEIAAELRDLRRLAPTKLEQAADAEPGDGPSPFEEEEDFDDEVEGEGGHWKRPSASAASRGAAGAPPARAARKWIVALDDTTVDHTAPRNHGQVEAQRTISMLQGLVIGDCKRLFKVAPILVPPARSRHLLGIKGRGLDVRAEVYRAARAAVSEFPEVMNEKKGVLSEDTYLLSDAWASARFSQRSAMLGELRADIELVAEVRKEVLKNKQLQRISEAVLDLYPRKAGRELQEVLDSRTERMIDVELHRFLDGEADRAKRAGASHSRKGQGVGSGAGSIKVPGVGSGSGAIGEFIRRHRRSAEAAEVGDRASAGG
mmetsp:Transcript_89767/g.257182  ORF Transcript_89767/g.257182 Transcript_89767/m.257182 type:complete len:432 (-) Transcript_89767:21-1316(-)